MGDAVTKRPHRWLAMALVPFAAMGLAACNSKSGDDQSATKASISLADAEKIVKLYRSPTCGCCHEYIGYLENAGFDVSDEIRDDMNPVKEQFGIPYDEQSCHTSEIAGYFVEGHVPIQAIVDLVTTKPDIDGIALPGMPPGSPGMEGDKDGPWVVVELKDGEVVGELGRY